MEVFKDVHMDYLLCMQRTGFVVVRFKRSVGEGLNGSLKIIHVFIELKKQPNGKKT